VFPKSKLNGVTFDSAKPEVALHCYIDIKFLLTDALAILVHANGGKYRALFRSVLHSLRNGSDASSAIGVAKDTSH
jgi:hypothetical protein